MKIANGDVHGLALAAFLVGAFSVSPLARAIGETGRAGEGESPLSASFSDIQRAEQAASAIRQEDSLPSAEDSDLASFRRDGMRMSDIRAAGVNFKVRLSGENIVFEGSMPRKCAGNRSMDGVLSSPAEGEKPGRHALKINMPECDGKALTNAEKRDLVYVKDAFPAKGLDASIDGEVCFLYSEGGVEPTCDPVMGPDGKPLKFVSRGTIDKGIMAAAIKKADAAKAEKQKWLTTKLGDLCRAGDFETFNAELVAAGALVENVDQVLKKLDGAKRKALENAISKAPGGEVKEAYEAFLAAAEENDWDSEDVTKSYIERRKELIAETVNDSGISASTRAAAVRELAADLREAGAYRENKGVVSWSYAQIATNFSQGGNYDEAEKYFTKAKETATAEDKVKLEQEMAKMFSAAKDACLAQVAEGKTKAEKCDKLAEKAKSHMDGAIAAQGGVGGEEAQSAANGMKGERIQMFGMSGAMAATVPGYGTMTVMGGGMYDMQKRASFQQGQQKQLMELMMRQSMGVTGGLQPTGSSYFR